MRRTLAGLAALAALTACTAEDPGPTGPSPSDTPSATATTPTAAPATAAPRPENGRCYRLTYADAVAPTTEVGATRCRAAHTSQTYFVGTIDAVVDGHLLAVDSRRVQDAIAADCPRRLGRYLGGTAEDLRLSMLRAIWFSPSIDASDAGQDWYRCDLIALAGDERLATLGDDLQGALGRDDAADRFGMCGTADPEDPDFQRVICSTTHRWEAISTVDATGTDYPGAGRLRTDGKAACEDPARAVAPDPLTVTWSYEPPTRRQWRAGRHYGICWVPTA